MRASGVCRSETSLADPVRAPRTTTKTLRLQSVDATHWLKRSAGVRKLNVFLGRSLSCRATAFNLSHQDIEDLLAQRGIIVSRESRG